MIEYALLPLLSYLIGSIPFGYLLVRIKKGVDIRTIGSGNLGATNVSRALGLPWFGVCFFLDFLKGFVPAFVIGGLAVAHLGAPEEVRLLYGFAAVAGHMFPIYLGFKGGKGVATATGALVGVVPAAAGIAAVAFLVTLFTARMVSLGSIVAAIVLPIAYVILEGSQAPSLTLAALIGLAVLIVAKHHANIGRILKGTEPKIGPPGARKESPDA